MLESTQHGKVCHDRCAIYEIASDCVMPREGIFARVIRSGRVKVGDRIEILGRKGSDGYETVDFIHTRHDLR